MDDCGCPLSSPAEHGHAALVLGRLLAVSGEFSESYKEDPSSVMSDIFHQDKVLVYSPSPSEGRGPNRRYRSARGTSCPPVVPSSPTAGIRSSGNRSNFVRPRQDQERSSNFAPPHLSSQNRISPPRCSVHTERIRPPPRSSPLVPPPPPESFPLSRGEFPVVPLVVGTRPRRPRPR